MFVSGRNVITGNLDILEFLVCEFCRYTYFMPIHYLDYLVEDAVLHRLNYNITFLGIFLIKAVAIPQWFRDRLTCLKSGIHILVVSLSASKRSKFLTSIPDRYSKFSAKSNIEFCNKVCLDKTIFPSQKG